MKIATRYLLPLEICMSLVMLSWGLSGWAGGGQLWKTLERAGQTTEWGLALCLVGAAQLLVTLLEWFIGRRWPDSHILRSVSARLWSAFISASVWLYACYIVATLPEAWTMIELVVQAPVGIGFSAWIFFENMKVACVLDPRVPTQGLQRRLQIERQSLSH